MASDKKKETTEKLGWKKNTVLYLHDLVYLLLAIVLTFLLLFRIIVVSGDSMYSTLIDGDYLLLLSNVFYHDPEPKDIIVISKKSYDNGSPIIKRVIATEGQIVDIIAGTFFICDCSGSNFGSLSQEQQQKYLRMFKYPERFLKINGEIAALKYNPNEKGKDR